MLIEVMLVKARGERMSFGDVSSGRMRQVAAELDWIRYSLSTYQVPGTLKVPGTFLT